MVIFFVAFVTSTVLGPGAADALRSGRVHVEKQFATPLLVDDLRADVAALEAAGLFESAGSGGRAGAVDHMRSAVFADPVERGGDRGRGDWEAFFCLWERLDLVRDELQEALGVRLLPEMEVHYVRYPPGGFYERHVDDSVGEVGDEARSSRR